MILNGPTLNLLFIGDIVGKGGRKAVKALVPQLKQQYMCTFVIANGENCAAGAGLNKSCLGEMADVVDVFTSGDHTWDRKEFEDEIRGMKNVVRPANMSKLQPGRGWLYTRNPAGGEVAVISLMGKVFMPRISSSNSLRSHVWSPDVKTSTLLISRRQDWFIPAPAAQFSPFAITNVHMYCCFSFGTSALTALRPPLPTMSPINSKLSVGPFKFILLKNSCFDLKKRRKRSIFFKSF